MVVEEADLAGRLVDDLVAMDAMRQEHAGITDPHPQYAGFALRLEPLRPAVAGDGEDIQPDLAQAPRSILEPQRDIAEDAARDAPALDIDGNPFGNPQRAVGADLYVGTEGAYLLDRRGSGDRAGQDQPGEDDAREELHPAGRAKETSGTARSDGSSISKYSSLWKPKALATMLEGKLSTLMLRSRAAPL